MIRFAAVALMLVAVTGCSNTPKLSSLTPSAAARLFTLKSPVDGGATLTVLRDKSFVGSAVDYRILC